MGDFRHGPWACSSRTQRQIPSRPQRFVHTSHAKTSRTCGGDTRPCSCSNEPPKVSSIKTMTECSSDRWGALVKMQLSAVRSGGGTYKRRVLDLIEQGGQRGLKAGLITEDDAVGARRSAEAAADQALPYLIDRSHLRGHDWSIVGRRGPVEVDRGGHRRVRRSSGGEVARSRWPTMRATDDRRPESPTRPGNTSRLHRQGGERTR